MKLHPSTTILPLVAGLALAASLVTNTALAQAGGAGTITVRADSWAPYCADPKDALPGYGIEILKQVFEKKGYTVDYQIMPWKRAVEEVKAGKWNIAIGATKSECEGFVFPAEEIGTIQNTFYVKKGTAWKFDGVESLKKVRLGCIEAYEYEPAVDAYIASTKDSDKVQPSGGETPLEVNIRKLRAGRIDAMIETPQVVAWTLKQMNVPEGEIIPANPARSPEDIYTAFSPAKPDSKKLADELSAGIKELRQSGELKKILAKYGLTDWKK